MTTDEHLTTLRRLLEDFLVGRDRTTTVVAAIEEILLGPLGDDDSFEDLRIAVASYEPGGGDYLYDEAMMLPVVRGAIAELDTRGSA
jgi:hypothetical protein